MGDIISNFKIENPERPNKAIVYPFALLILLFIGYLNIEENFKEFSKFLMQWLLFFLYQTFHS